MFAAHARVRKSSQTAHDWPIYGDSGPITGLLHEGRGQGSVLHGERGGPADVMSVGSSAGVWAEPPRSVSTLD